MKDRLEHNKEFKKAEEIYDVVKLISIIKKISYGDANKAKSIKLNRSYLTTGDYEPGAS